jgi:hypothetical protein
VSSLPVADLVGARARRLPRVVLPAAALAVAAVAAVAIAVAARPHGATHRPGRAPAPAFGGWIAGVPMQQAACRHWLAAAPAERAGAVAALRATVGGQSTTGGWGTALADDRATRLFDARCAQPGAQGFLLYELYTRAAAFSRR